METVDMVWLLVGLWDGRVLAFGGVEVRLPIFRPAGADVTEFFLAVKHYKG